MKNPDDLELTPLERLKVLSYEQWVELVSKGVVSVESFVGLARSQPERLAKLLNCSLESLDRLRREAEALAGSKFDDVQAPDVPPPGLIPPGQRPKR